MKILVCGGRDFDDKEFLFKVLDYVNLTKTITLIIHGGAKGADTLAGEWAKARQIPYCVFYANCPKHGKKAGPIRNQLMLDEGGPDGVIAFSGGNGTQDMINRAKNYGFKVWIAKQS